MQTSIKFKWKDDFLNRQWYRENPAEFYLSEETKKNMLYLLYLEVEDLDSEAEIVIETQE